MTFTILSTGLLGIDYYNGASGRGRHAEFPVPDASYLLAEILGISEQLLVDINGRPLSPTVASFRHSKLSAIETFRQVMQQLQNETAELPPEPVAPSAAPLRGLSSQGVVTVTPLIPDGEDRAAVDLILVLAVASVVLTAVLLVALAPPSWGAVMRLLTPSWLSWVVHLPGAVQARMDRLVDRVFVDRRRDGEHAAVPDAAPGNGTPTPPSTENSHGDLAADAVDASKVQAENNRAESSAP